MDAIFLATTTTTTTTTSSGSSFTQPEQVQSTVHFSEVSSQGAASETNKTFLRLSRSNIVDPVIQPINKLISQGEMADDPSYDPNQVRVIDIMVFTFLFAIAAPANFKIIKCLIWTQNSTKLYKKSRHHFLLLNLAIADAIVLFIMIPAEVGWRVTASWKAGNIGCKIFGFVRVFGLYASSMILICISIDRYYAVVQPFKYGSAARRISRLLKASWVLSVILSIPQLFFFRLQSHPRDSTFIQCVTFDSFKETWLGDDMERWYSVANVFFLYGLPLVVILICYIQICIKSFSHRNCKSSERPSGILGTNGTNTNEALGASFVILPVPEDEEGEDEEENEDEENKEQNHHRLHGITDEEPVKDDGTGEITPRHVEKKVVKVSTNEIKQQSEEVTNENGQFKTISPSGDSGKDAQTSAAAASALANGLSEKECKILAPFEERKSSRVKTKLKYVQDEDESDVNQMHLMDVEGQSMMMSSLAVTSTENRSNASATKTTTDSVTCSANIAIQLRRNERLAIRGNSVDSTSGNVIDGEKVSEAIQSGKCSVITGVNYSISMAGGGGGSAASKVRSRKQSEVRKSILRQTLVIVLAFFVCWTPYAMLVICFQFDRESFKPVEPVIDYLFLFAVSNSAVNPYIYGKFVKSNSRS